ncbi:MAG: rod shape-determining protein MreC [Bacilli bacterium]|nr:rod shape-determining protein MreC [Bacilli bacterium]
MYHKKNKNNKIMITLSILVVIILICLSFNFNRKGSVIENILKSISTTANDILFSPLKLFNTEKDVNQSESYLIQKNVNDSLQKEVEELRQQLELNRTLTGYEAVNATILSRNKTYWFNNMMIDKGKKDGIKEGMAVITKNGLIGKISKSYHNSSEIKLITSDDTNYKVSVSIKTNDSENIAILNGYDVEKGLVKLVVVSKTTNLEVGNQVLTSGLGGVFPGGIYIGEVKKIESDKYNLSNNVYVKTAQDFNNIHYVTVLKTVK